MEACILGFTDTLLSAGEQSSTLPH